ncbi:MAG: hypothetical protein ABJB78_07625, partial [Betaproteobacteria bacterium]
RSPIRRRFIHVCPGGDQEFSGVRRDERITACGRKNPERARDVRNDQSGKQADRYSWPRLARRGYGWRCSQLSGD